MNNKLIKGIISISLLSAFLFSANIKKVETAEKVFTTIAPIPMSGTPILNDLETVALLSRIGNASNEIKLKKTQIDSLGMNRDFFVFNIVTEEFDVIEFKLLAKGNLAQVWCAIEEIDKGHLTQQVADSFLVYLEKKSGASSVDPSRGVIAIDQEYFGTPPNKDGDDLLDVFVCDIKDAWEVGSDDGYVAGFFFSVDQYNDADIIDQGYRSNERDIIYIDSYPGVFLNDLVRYHGGITTTAHEYQHLIHYNYDGSEYTIVNEGLSENAEYITGLATRSADRYLENVNVPIFKWDREGDVLKDYARASLFYNYIGDRFGLRNYKYHTQGEMNGKNGIESAIDQSIKPTLNFSQLIHDFHIANLINDRSVAEKYAYANPARNGLWIPEQAAHLMLDSPESTGSYDLERGGAGYISLSNINNLNSKFMFSDDIFVTAVIYSGADIVYTVPITNGENFEIPYKSEAYEKVTFVMSNTIPSGNEETTSLTSSISWDLSGSYNSYRLNTYGPPPNSFWKLPYFSTISLKDRFGFSNKYTMPEDGLLSQLKLYVASGIDNEGDAIEIKGEGLLRFAIYSDLNGAPADVIKQDTVNFDSLKPLWNFIDIESWKLEYAANDLFHVVYEFIVPVLNSAVNSVPLRLDNGLGKQGVSKIITAANIFETIFIDSSTMGEYGVWNEIIYTIETDASVVILETPSNFNIIGGDKEITLQWSSVSNSDFKHYTIYGGTDRNNLTIKKTISDISAKSLFISSLTNGEEYYYCISQTDLTGKESVRSFVLSIVPLSLDIADFSIGVLQNPIYTENIDVYVTSNSDMEDWTVELFYQWNESISEIKLENINGKVFQNTAFTLSKAGNYELTANGKRLNAVYSGYDTLRFSSQLLKAGQRLSIQSTDKRLKLDVSGDRSENAYWLTIFNKSMNQIQSSDAFECLNKLYQIGLDSKKISGQMMFNIEDETDPRSLFIAKKEGDCFKILKTNYDSKEKVLLASMSEAGSYFIAKSKAGIQNFDGLQPKYFELKQNYPNPFNPSTTLEFSLIETDHITLEIYNMLGQKIKTIVSAQHFPGNYSYIWNGLNHSGVQVASGLYFYRIRGNNVQDIKKMVLTR